MIHGQIGRITSFCSFFFIHFHIFVVVARERERESQIIFNVKDEISNSTRTTTKKNLQSFLFFFLPDIINVRKFISINKKRMIFQYGRKKSTFN